MYNVLLVDDSIFAVEAVKSTVDWGELSVDNVFFAYSMQQAKGVFNQHTIHLILCDIEMPYGSGLDLAAWIVRFYPSTKIMFLTGHTDFLYAQEALRYGAYDYLIKPVPTEELSKKIYNALNSVDKNMFLSKCSAEIENQVSLIHEIVSYIKGNLSKDLSRDSIAKYVHISSNYLSRLFSKEMEQPLLTYILKERVEKAKEYLLSTDMHISKIAIEVGIHNTSHFIKLFKRETGYTPLAFKKEHVDTSE